MIFFSEAQLRHAIKEYVVHYHLERNLCLGNRLLKSGAAANCDGDIHCHWSWWDAEILFAPESRLRTHIGPVVGHDDPPVLVRPLGDYSSVR